jgi:hypothetical protein
MGKPASQPAAVLSRFDNCTARARASQRVGVALIIGPVWEMRTKAASISSAVEISPFFSRETTSWASNLQSSGPVNNGSDVITRALHVMNK